MMIYIFVHAFIFIAAGWVILSFQGLSRSKALWMNDLDRRLRAQTDIAWCHHTCEFWRCGVPIRECGASLHPSIFISCKSPFIHLALFHHHCLLLCHPNIQFLTANASLARLRSVLFYLSSSFYGVASCSEYIQPNSFILLNWHILRYHVHKFCAQKQGL